MSVFVFEIGTEELPARFLAGVEQELSERFTKALGDANVDFDALCVQTTPRRATVSITGIAAVQRSSEEIIPGPPVRIAYDAEGNPTKAALGFIKTQGVTLEDAFKMTTEKGEYLAVKKQSGGKKTVDILAEFCPTVIAALPFPKKMHWGSGTFGYARPLRWVLALFDDAVVPFAVPGVAGLSSGRETYGHRVHGYGPFSVASAADYAATIQEKCQITLNGAERRSTIINGGNALGSAAGGTILWKDSLLDEVQGLAEHPVPCLGNFDPSFLELPREVLLTSMESHQKSFGVENANGTLLPHFLTILNITPKSMALVQKGWERVLRARLEDARFFWNVDLATDFDTWLERLDSVVFLQKIGSMGEKTRRLSALCYWLAKHIAPENAELAENAKRAGRLSKADLVSGMVGEFDTLQGIMGGIYARRKGENDAVAAAISEQYLPAGPDSPVPASLCGALVSIADKADTLAGCFGLGMIPTGAADPYALRRAALGIVRIMIEHKLRFDVEALFTEALAQYGEREWKLQPQEAAGKLREFFVLRLKNFFVSQGAETLLAEAAISADSSDVWAVSARLEALTIFSKSEGFSEALLTFKRAANIIRKQGVDAGVVLSGEYSDALLQDDAERALAATLKEVAPRFDALWAAEDYTALFALLGELRPAVDAFFEKVMVMCEDKELRANRLNLLQNLVSRLAHLADFAALQL